MLDKLVSTLDNYTIEDGCSPNSFIILENEFITVGEIHLTVDDDGMIEVDGKLKNKPFYFLIDSEKKYLYLEMKKYVIIYDMEAFKKDVFKKIKEAE